MPTITALDWLENATANSHAQLIFDGASFPPRTSHTVIWWHSYNSSSPGYKTGSWLGVNNLDWDGGVYTVGTSAYPANSGSADGTGIATDPGGSGGNTHYFEHAMGLDKIVGPMAAFQIIKDGRWYLHARTVSVSGGFIIERSYPDVVNSPGSYIEYTRAVGDIGSPASPALYWGGSGWRKDQPSAGQNDETPGGRTRGKRIYDTDLAVADIAAEGTSESNEPVTAAGISSVWYININPTPTDVADKQTTRTQHNPRWDGANRPNLFSETTGPTITVQPTSQTANNGATATFTVTATGATTYQWKRNGVNVGTNSASYTTPALTYADQGAQITVDVSDGTDTITSAAASIIVAWNTSGIGAGAVPLFGGPFGAGAFGSNVRDLDAGSGAINGTVASATTATATSTPAGTQTSGGTVAAATTATALSTPAGTQTYQGAVAGASTATALSVFAASTAVNGAVAPASTATAASTVAGTQTSGGTVSGATTATAASTPAGTQTYVGAVDGAATATALATAAGTSATNGAVAPMSQANATSTVAGTQTSAGNVATATTATAASTVAGTQTHNGTVAPAATDTALGTASGNSGSQGAAAPASTATALSTPAGTQTYVGTVADAASATSASTPAGVQVYAGTVAAATTGTVLATAAGTQGDINGAVAPLSGSTTTSAPAGTQVYVGSVAPAATATAASDVAGTYIGVYFGVVSGLVSQTLLSTVNPIVLPSEGSSRYGGGSVHEDDHVEDDEAEQVAQLLIHAATAIVLSGVLDG